MLARSQGVLLALWLHDLPMIVRVLVVVLFFQVLSVSGTANGVVTTATASPTYHSIAEAIQTSKGQGTATLNIGRFNGTQDELRFTIINSKTKEMAFRFDYNYGFIQSGYIEFGQFPIVVVAKQNDLCAAVEVQKVAVKAGNLDEANSKFRVLSNHPDCKFPKSELASGVAALFRLPKGPNKFFQANLFEWQQSPAQAFFNEVTFAPEKNAPGLKIEFAENAPIEFGRGDSLVLGAGGQASFTFVSIVVQTKKVDARLSDLKLPLKDGTITSTGFVIKPASGSDFQAANLNIDSRDGSVTFKDGKISGKAGPGTTITISNGSGTRASKMELEDAELSLIGIDLSVSGDDVKFSARTASFDSALRQADLQLGPGLRLILGAGRFHVEFRCPAGSPTDCRPIVAETGSPILSVGKIHPLTITSKSGSYISDLGEIKLDRGEVQTGELEFDSRKENAPLWGNIVLVDLALSAQVLQLDRGFQLRAVSGSLKGKDLTISSKDGLPEGDLDFNADIAEIVGNGIGQIATIRGSSEMTALLHREVGQSIHILKGNIKAQITAKTDTVSTGASLAIEDLDLYRGNGGARFTLNIPQLNYEKFIPGFEEPKDFPGGDVTVKVHEQTLKAQLTTGISLSKRRVDIKAGKWSIEDTSFPLEAKLSLSDGELVSAPVELAGIKVCTSKVTLPFSNFLARFGATLVVRNGNLGFHTTPFQISPFPKPEIEGKTCKNAVTIICGIAGSLLGPIGSIGGAYLCHEKFDEGQEKLQTNLNNLVRDGIQSIRFDVGA